MKLLRIVLMLWLKAYIKLNASHSRSKFYITRSFYSMPSVLKVDLFFVSCQFLNRT